MTKTAGRCPRLRRGIVDLGAALTAIGTGTGLSSENEYPAVGQRGGRMACRARRVQASSSESRACRRVEQFSIGGLVPSGNAHVAVGKQCPCVTSPVVESAVGQLPFSG